MGTPARARGRRVRFRVFTSALTGYSPGSDPFQRSPARPQGVLHGSQATRSASGQRTAPGAHPGGGLLQRRPRPQGQHGRRGAQPRPAVRQDVRGALAARAAAARPGAQDHRGGAEPQAGPHGHGRRGRHGPRPEPRRRGGPPVRADRARGDRAGLRAVAQRRGAPRIPVRLRGGRLRPGRAQPRLADHGAGRARGPDGGGPRRGRGRGGGAGDDGRARRPRPAVRQRARAPGGGALPGQRGLGDAVRLVPGGGGPAALRGGRPADRARRVHGGGHRRTGPRPAVLHPGAAARAGGRGPGLRRLRAGRLDEPSRRAARKPREIAQLARAAQEGRAGRCRRGRSRCSWRPRRAGTP